MGKRFDGISNESKAVVVVVMEDWSGRHTVSSAFGDLIYKVVEEVNPAPWLWHMSEKSRLSR